MPEMNSSNVKEDDELVDLGGGGGGEDRARWAQTRVRGSGWEGMPTGEGGTA
jgi:hypothetical protein